MAVKVKNEIVKKHLPKLRKVFPVYAAFNLWITDKAGDLIRLNLKRAQRRCWNVIADLIDRDLPVRLYVIKGRQEGFTTLFTAILFWLSTLNKNRSYIAVAQDKTAAENICSRFQSYYYHSHPILQPEFRRMNRDMIHFASPIKKVNNGQEIDKDIGLDSKLYVMTADNETLGRSFTFHGALLTEICLWPVLGINVKSRLNAILKCIAKKAGTFVFAESTGQGDNYGKEFWEADNGFVKMFVSWLAEDEYRTRVTLEEYFDLEHDPKGQYGNELEERENIINELRYWYPEDEYYREDCDFPDQEGDDYEVWLQKEAMCRLAWRRENISGECGGDVWLFKQEYPTTIDDAFGTSSLSVFKHSRLMEVNDFIKNRKVQPTLFKYEHDNTNAVKDCNLKFFEQPYGDIRVWKLPEKGKKYAMGVDGAQGVPNGDDSSFVILECPTLEEVCSFNAIISPIEFAGMCNYIGEIYNNALMGVETNDKGGFAALKYLVDIYHYANLYYYVHPMKVELTGEVQYGFHNNAATRSIAISDGTDVFEKMQCVIYSKEIVKQMGHFIKYPDGKIKAAPGKHDDLVLAWLIAVQMSQNVHDHRIPETPKSNYMTHGMFRKMAEKRYGKEKQVKQRRRYYA